MALHERYTTNINTQYVLYDDTGVSGFVYVNGQTLQSHFNFTIEDIEFKLYRVGTGCGNLIAYLYAVDGSHLPTGSALATSAAVATSAITLDTDGEYITFTFGSSYDLIANTEYAIYLVADGGDASNLCNVKADLLNSCYHLGARLYSTDGGTSFSYLTGADVAFKINGIGAKALKDTYQGSQTAFLALTLNAANDWAGQSFTPSETYTISDIALWCAKGAGDNVGTLTFEIYGVDGSGHPTGVAIADGTIDDANVLTTYSWHVCTLNNQASLVANTKYCLVIHGTSLDASNVLVATYDNDVGVSQYADGDMEWSIDGGSSWSTTTTHDIVFRTYGLIPATDKWRILLTEHMPLVTPHFADTKLANRTVSRLLGTDGQKITTSEDLASWVTGTANQLTVTDDADGSITLSTPQDTHTGASNFTVAGQTITGNSVFGLNSSVFQPNTDSTTFFQILDADGGVPVFNVDTTNERVGIKEANPLADLHITSSEAILCKFDVHRTGNGTSAIQFNRASIDVENGFWWATNDAFKFFIGQNNQADENIMFYNNIVEKLSLYVHGPTNKIALNTESFNEPSALFEVNGDLTDDILCQFNITRTGDGTSAILFNRASVNVENGFWWATDSDRKFFIGQNNQADENIMFYNAVAAKFSIYIDGLTNNIGFNELAPETMFEATNSNPYFTFHNSTHEDSDGGRESRINFKGEQSGGEETTLVRIEVGHDGVADDEKGYWDLFINDGSDGDSPTKRIRMDSNGLNLISPSTAGPILSLLSSSNEIKISLDNSSITDRIIFGGQIVDNHTSFLVDAQSGYDSSLYLRNGSNFSSITHQGNTNDLVIDNDVQDSDIVFAIDDGGVPKNIRWDADVDKLKHSAGTFDFDDDNITTTGIGTFGTAKIGGATDYAQFASDGELTLAGTARVTVDDYITASGVKAPGAHPATFIEYGLCGAWQFADQGVAANHEQISGTYKLPSQMDKTAVPIFKIGWSANGVSPGNCEWQLEYLYRSPNEDTTAAAQETLMAIGTASSTSDGFIITSFSGMDLPSPTDQAMFFRITRLSAGGNDTIADDVELRGMLFTHTRNKLGAAT